MLEKWKCCRQPPARERERKRSKTKTHGQKGRSILYHHPYTSIYTHLMWQMTSIIYHSFSFSFFLLLTSSDSDVHCGWDPVYHGRSVSHSSGQSCDSTAAASSNERGKRGEKKESEKKEAAPVNSLSLHLQSSHSPDPSSPTTAHTHTHHITCTISHNGTSLVRWTWR